MVTSFEAAKAAVESNGRSLQLLDDRIAHLSKLLESSDEDVGQYPYFYGAIGADDLEGIRLAPEGAVVGVPRNLVYEGRIDIQEDAPFVWTHILTTFRNTTSTAPVDTSFKGTFYSDDDSSFDSIHIGFVERSSGHVLFQSELLSPGIAAATSPFNLARDRVIAGQIPASSTLSTAGMYIGANLVTVAGPPGAVATGNGPNFAYPLQTEVLLPLSGAITVQAKVGMNSRALNASLPPRVFVSLLGYKILGE